MGIQLPGALFEARAYIGLPFPSTSETALQGRAGQWQQLGTQAGQAAARIAQSVAQVQQANSGDAAQAFAEFMASASSNVASLRDFQQACVRAAVAHQIAAATITSLKMFMIAQLSIVQTAIHTAKVVGPPALPALQTLQMQARAAIQAATNGATQQLRAG